MECCSCNPFFAWYDRGRSVKILSRFSENMQVFLRSDLARRMSEAELRPENGPYREIPFALAVPNEHDDFSLVQGMIDSWFIDSDGEAVLVDYKSDRLSGSTEEKKEELKSRYQVQLDMYAQAITAATGVVSSVSDLSLLSSSLSQDVNTVVIAQQIRAARNTVFFIRTII